MGFAQHIDYPGGISTLGSAYTAGDPSVTVASGTGSQFGSPTATNPVRFTMAEAGTPTSCCHYSCTGRSGDTLTGVTVLHGTDQDFSIGDSIFNSIYGEDLADIQAATVTVTAGAGLSGGGAIALNGSATIGLAAGTANTLAGYNAGGAFSGVTVGSGLALSGGTLTATGGGGGSGTVTSVAMTGDGTVFQSSVSGSPITISGTLAPALVGQARNTLLAGPTSGANAAPTFRALASGDFGAGIVPNSGLANSSLTVTAGTGLSGGGPVSLGASVTLGVATGTANSLAGYDGSGVFSGVAVGSGLSLSAGTLSSTAGGGSVTSITAGVGLSASPNPITGAGTISLATPVAVASGGTGSATLAAHGVLLGAGTSSLGVATVGTAGRVLIDQGAGADPAFGAISGSGATVSLSSAGVLAISAIANGSLSNSSVTVTAGTGLSGGGAVSLGGTITLNCSAVPNSALQNSSVTVATGAGLSGGGPVSLGGTITHSLAIFGPTAVKSGPYTAAANDLVPVDASSGSVTVTLPTAPADRTIVGVKLIATSGANACTVAAGGSDVFNKAAGSTTLTLAVANQTVFLQYAASPAIWYVVAADNSSGGYVAGTNVTITTSGGVRTIAATGGGGSGSPGGSSGNLQYNSAGAFAGAANLNVGSAGQLNFGSISAPGSPAVGDEWLDSTQKCRAFFGGPGGLLTYHSRIIYVQTANVTVTASGATSLVNTTGAVGGVALPTGFLNVPGRTIRLRGVGFGTSGASAVGSVGWLLTLGGSLVGTTGNQALSTSQANRPWDIDVLICVKQAGSSGLLDIGGQWTLQNNASNGVAGGFCNGTTAGTQAPQTQVSANLTGAPTLDFQINLSAIVNSFTCSLLVIEVLA